MSVARLVLPRPPPAAAASGPARRPTSGGIVVVVNVWMPSAKNLTGFRRSESEWCESCDDQQTATFQRETFAPALSVFPDGWDAQGAKGRAARHILLGRELSSTSWMERLRGRPIETVKILVRASRRRWSDR